MKISQSLCAYHSPSVAITTNLGAPVDLALNTRSVDIEEPIMQPNQLISQRVRVGDLRYFPRYHSAIRHWVTSYPLRSVYGIKGAYSEKIDLLIEHAHQELGITFTQNKVYSQIEYSMEPSQLSSNQLWEVTMRMYESSDWHLGIFVQSINEGPYAVMELGAQDPKHLEYFEAVCVHQGIIQPRS